jgi:low temperature requirement protein LtrA
MVGLDLHLLGHQLARPGAGAGSAPLVLAHACRPDPFGLAPGSVWRQGGFAQDTIRLAWWSFALGLEYLAPSVGFWTPGLGRSTTSDWDVEGGHLAERGSLFIIIALGESVLVTGAAFAGLAWTPETTSAFAVDFAGSVAMWWI